jgi:hypothetical protein
MCRTRLKPHGRRFDPVPAHHIRPGQRARGRDYPVRVAPDSGMVPAWPLGHHYDAGLGTASRALSGNRGDADVAEVRRDQAYRQKSQRRPKGISQPVRQ